MNLNIGGPGEEGGGGGDLAKLMIFRYSGDEIGSYKKFFTSTKYSGEDMLSDYWRDTSCDGIQGVRTGSREPVLGMSG